MAVRPGVWLGALASALLSAAWVLVRGVDAVALDTNLDARPETLAAVCLVAPVEQTAVVRTSVEAPAQSEAADLPAPSEDRDPGEPSLAMPDVEHCIEDLRDDNIRGNATTALRRLRQLDRSMIPVLERALTSPDVQQRHLVAEVLYGLDAPASRLLVEVAVQALGHDVSRVIVATGLASPAASATRYLADHTAAALAELRFGLGSADPQQRFLCAFLLAQGGHALDADVVCRELIEHLADNHIQGDALMATHGLYRLGERGQTSARAWRPYVDEQARALLDLIDLDLRTPPRDRRELAHRGTLQRVTSVYHDPALQFDIKRSRVATW